MRAATTILLLLATVASWGAYRWVMADGRTRPPPANGKPIIRFDINEVSEIQLRRGGEAINLNPTNKVWYLTHPLSDRLDPTAALALYFGLNGLELYRTLPAAQWKNEHEAEHYGLGREAVKVRLLDQGKKTLHEIRLGHLTPWRKGGNPTLYVQWRDGPNPEDILVVAGNLRTLLDRPFDMLRARQALYLPSPPMRISLQQGESRVELARAGPDAPWRMLKPLDDRADPGAIEAFLRSLSELEASSLTPWEEAPFPEQDAIRLAIAMQPPDPGEARRALAAYERISARDPITYQPAPSLLQAVFRPAPGRNATPEVVARFNDRPHDLHLPLKTLDLLVPDAARFRARTLADLAPGNLARIEVQDPSSVGEAVQLESKADEWFVFLRGNWVKADAARLRFLVTRFNQIPVLAYPTDILTRPEGYGLAAPRLQAAFAFRDGHVRRLRLGQADGKTFAWFEDRSTVCEVPEAALAALPVSPAAWRSRTLLDFAAADVRQVVVSRPGQADVALRYNPEENLWTALQGSKDRSADLDRVAAANLTNALEHLRAQRWLSAGLGPAQSAMAQPDLVLRFSVVPTSVDGTAGEVRRYKLDLARTGEQSPSFYGRLNDEPDVFLVKEQAVEALEADLFPPVE